MRALLPLLLIAACSQAPTPQADLAGEFNVEPPKQVCSTDGKEALLYELEDGTELDPIPTGRGCDYESNRAYRETYGEYPNAPWRHQTYEEWRARQGEREG